MHHFMRSALYGLSALFVTVLLCSCDNLLLLSPKGPIAHSERFVLLTAVALMLVVVIPVMIMVLWFPGKYRATNPRATYMPGWSRSRRIELVVWLVPAVIITLLSILVWRTTYSLDPHRPIDAGVAPVRIDVVSLDWKWLFIYPDQKIATVNDLVFPAGVPLSFRLTSASVMTSFFIPQLGSQIYAMAGMQTRLHLLADAPGTFRGQNQQFSGDGYADMHFKARAVSKTQFVDWVGQVRQSADRLDSSRYAQLARPGADHRVIHFSAVKTGLFDDILRAFDHSAETTPQTDAPISAGGKES